MPRVCPRCNNAYNDRWVCPACNVRLLPSGSAVYELSESPFPTPEANWQQTTIGRTLVGLLLSQGLYYGLWQLSTAIVMALSNEGLIAAWSSPVADGWVWWVLQCLQVFSLLLGGTMAGAGQRRGVLLGLAMGLLNSMIYLLTQIVLHQQPLTSEALIGQVSFQAICGALGGFLGSMIWKPATPILGPAAAHPGTTPVPPVRRTTLVGAQRLFRPFRGPVAWIRVLTGTVIAVGGSYWSHRILIYMIHVLSDGGRRHVEFASQRHPLFVTWEVSILALLVGGAWSGANTKNGLKQGLLVGLFGTLSLTLLGMEFGKDFFVPQTIIFVYFLQYKPDFGEPLTMIYLTFLGVMPFAMLGGWFGSQLLPPLLRQSRRKRVHQMSA